MSDSPLRRSRSASSAPTAARTCCAAWTRCSRHPPAGALRGAGARQRLRATAPPPPSGSASATRVELIALDRRRGKAENDSELMARGRGRWLLLLNEDSRARRPAPPTRCATRSRPRRGPASRAPASSIPQGAQQPSAWRFPGVRERAGRRAVPASPADACRAAATRCARSTGCSRPGMLVRREAFEQVGAARPRLLRVLGRGRLAEARPRRGLVGAVRARPRRSCTASSSRTARGARRRIVEFSRNRDRYMRKHHGPAAAARRCAC